MHHWFQLNFAILSMRIGFDPFCVTCLVSVSSINSLMPGRETQTAWENEQLSFQYFERIVFNGTIERPIRKNLLFLSSETS